MDPAVAIHVLFSQLDAGAKKIMVRKMFAMQSLYTDEELCDCIVLLPYPDELWYTIDRDVKPYLSVEKLWTDDESKWTEHLKPVLLSDLRRYKDVVYRYVLSVYPDTQVIPDLTYENVFAIIRKKKDEVEDHITSIMPKSKGYINMKRKEYLAMMAVRETAAEGRRLAEQLIRTQYHPVVRNYIWWPLSKALLKALLREELDYREGITALRHKGWVPMNYIDLCRGPLTWEADEVGADAEAGAGTGGHAHARDVCV